MLSSRSRSPGIASDVTATMGSAASSARAADLADDRLAAAARDLHVEQQQVRRDRRQSRARFVDRRRLHHLVPAQRQEVVDQEPVEGVVLDDQDARRRDRSLRGQYSSVLFAICDFDGQGPAQGRIRQITDLT